MLKRIIINILISGVMFFILAFIHDSFYSNDLRGLMNGLMILPVFYGITAIIAIIFKFYDIPLMIQF